MPLQKRKSPLTTSTRWHLRLNNASKLDLAVSFRSLTIVLAACCCFFCVLPVAPSRAAVPKRLETVVKQKIIPSYRQHELNVSRQLLTNLLDKLDADDVKEIDGILTDNKVPKLGELMLNARMAAVLAKNEKMGKADPREAAYAMPVLKERIEKLLAEVETMEVYAEQLPEYDSLDEYQESFWDIHVAANKLKNAAKMTKFGTAFVDRALREKLTELSDDEVEQLDIRFDTLSSQLSDTARELAEIKAELRINAVNKATKIVRESKDFKQRLRAAYVIDFDGQQVINFLRNKRTEFTRPILKDKNTLSSVLASVQYARDSAGDLAMKSRLLYLGMHWWMRGRYGEGPEGMGLLKSRAALVSPLAQFPLYMPIQPPKPVDPTLVGYSVPKFDRRHHYIWMYEYRTIQANYAQSESTSRTQHLKSGSVTKMSRFY